MDLAPDGRRQGPFGGHSPARVLVCLVRKLLARLDSSTAPAGRQRDRCSAVEVFCCLVLCIFRRYYRVCKGDTGENFIIIDGDP